VIEEVGGSLGHMAAVTGRADAAALAGEGHDESRAARHSNRAGEAEAEEPALEIAAEFVLDVSRHGPLGGTAILEPTLEVLGDDFEERRLLVTPSPNLDPGLVRESSCPDWGLKGFSDEEATQCRADRGLASAG
jgi:hypothetical protein